MEDQSSQRLACCASVKSSVWTTTVSSSTLSRRLASVLLPAPPNPEIPTTSAESEFVRRRKTSQNCSEVTVRVVESIAVRGYGLHRPVWYTPDGREAPTRPLL